MPIGESPLDVGTGDSAPVFQEPPKPKSGILDNLVAGYQSSRAGPASANQHENAYAKPYYEQVVTALNKRGGDFSNPLALHFMDPRWAADPLGMAAQEKQRIWARVAEERVKDPTFLKDLPDHDHFIARIDQDRQRDQAHAQEVMARAGLGGQIAAFVGQVAGGYDSPENYVGGPGSAPAKNIGREILKRGLEEGATNAVGAALALPGSFVDSRQHLGEDMTAGDAAMQVAESAAFGAVVGGAKPVALKALAPAGRALGKAFDATVEHLPQPIKDAAAAAAFRAGTTVDRATAADVHVAFRPFTPESTATPDEGAAMHVVERDADLREASPFHPGADPKNENRLAAVGAALGVKPIPDLPSPAPMPERAPAPATGAPGGYSAGVLKAEGYNAHAPAGSTITGYGQFSQGTWLGVYKNHFGAGGMTDAQILALRHDKNVAGRMIEAYGQDNGKYLRRHGLEDSDGNKSLAHFLGPRDAANILKADPSAPVRSVIDPRSFANNRKLLENKSASELIAWAHKRIGGSTPDVPVGRADAVPDVDYLDDAVPASMPPIEHRTFSPDELITDAPTMQVKPGGDSAGVTDRLASEEAWNGPLSGKIVVLQRTDGANVVVDGHQRLGLAQRLPEGAPKIDAMVLREADGVTPEMARAIAVAMAERPSPDRPVAEGLAHLSNEAFGAVLNDGIDPYVAAHIGALSPDQPHFHATVASMLKDVPPNVVASITKQALADSQSSPQSFPEALNDAVRTRISPDPRATERPNGSAGPRDGAADRSIPEQTGRPSSAGEADAQLADGRRLSDGATTYDQAVASERVSEGFSDPVGKDAQTQTDRIGHDVELSVDPAESFRLSEEGDERTFADILQEADADIAAVEALRGCL